MARAGAWQLATAALFAGIASPSVMAACSPASPTLGATVTCTGVPSLPLFLNTFSSAVGNLTVNVGSSAQMNSTLGGTVIQLTGNNITLNNAGIVDPSLLGPVTVMSNGVVIGNTANSVVNVTNAATGTLRGTGNTPSATLSNLDGLALNIANGNGGTTGIVNNGTIGSTPLLGATVAPADVPIVAVTGGSAVSMVNNGTLTGRVAFATSGTGNAFTNAGTLTGSVSLGAASTNVFTAVTGSTVSAGTGSGPSLPGPLGSGLTFAPTGLIDGGAAGSNTLVLQNPLGVGGGTTGTGTASSATYVNFTNLTQNSGTWTLQGPLVSGSTTLNGGVALFDSSATFGSGTLTANGGALQASTAGLSLANPITLGLGGLTAQGTNDMTFAGAISGAGGLVKNGSATLTLGGISSYLGNTQVNAGTLNLGGSLGSANVNVASGATLTGTGSVLGTLNIASGSHLGLASGSTLSVGGLVLGSTANLDAALAAPSTTSLLNIGGNLTLDGTLNVTDAGGFGVGLYRLINYTGALTNQGLDIGTVPVTVDPANLTVQTSVANQVNLLFGSPQTNIRFWDGSQTLPNGAVDGGSGTWTTGGTNWTSVNGLTNQTWAGDFAIFQGTAGTVTVNGPQTFNGMQFVTDGYNLVNGTAGQLTAVNGSGGTTAIRVDPGVTATIGVAIDGSGTLAKLDSGTLVLNGANSYTGGTALNGGMLVVGSNTALGTGTLSTAVGTTLDSNIAVTLANAVTLTGNLVIGGSNAVTLGGAVGGTGGLIKNGASDLTLDGANSYLGDTTLNAGKLIVGSGTALGQGALNAVAGTTLDASTPVTLSNVLNLAGPVSIGGTADLTWGGQVSGAGSLVKNGAATMTLNGANDFFGGTTLNAGSLTVGNNTALGVGGLTVDGAATLDSNAATTLKNAVALNAVLTVGGTQDLALGGAVSGIGALVKNGAATLTLNGDNTFTGGTSLNAGTLTLGNAAALGSGALTVAGASTLDNSAAFTLTNALTLNADLNVAGNNGLTLSGAIGGTGGLVKGGLADLTLSGNNTFTGALNIGSGSVTAASTGALGNTSGANISAGASLILTSNASLAGLSGSGDVQVGTGNTLSLGGIGTSSTFDGDVNGSGALTKVGTGTLSLTGINGLTGDTLVAAGTLNLTGALGSANVGVGGGATLTGTGSVLGALSIANGGHLGLSSGNTLSAGSLVLGSNANMDVALGAPSTSSLLNVGGNVTLDGRLNVSDAGGFGVGLYRLINYTGVLTDQGLDVGTTPGNFTGGDLQVQTSVGNQVNLVVSSPTGNLRFWNGSQTTGNGTVNGGSGSWNAASTNWTSINGQASQTWNNDFAVFQGAPGDVTVYGTQGFTGLQFATDGYRLLDGTAGQLTAVNGSGGTTAIRVDPGVTATIDAGIDGSGTLAKLDSGTLVLNGANSYTGGTAFEGGTLVVGSNTALGAGTLSTAAGTTLDSNIAVTLANAVTLTGNLTLGGSNALTLGGVVAGTGGLTKNGADTLTLNGSNTYASGTTLNAGNLALGNATALGSGALTVGGASTLDSMAALALANGVTLNAGLTVGGSNDLTLGGVVSGNGGLTKSGAATLTLNGSNSYLGGTTLNAGTVTLGNAAALGSGALNVAGASTLDNTVALTLTNGVTLNAGLTVGGSNDLTLAGGMGGSGGLTKNGAATLTLGGSNVYLGATQVTAGTLAAGVVDALPTGTSLTVGSGATFDLNGFDATVGGLAGVGSVALGSSRLTTGGDNGDTTFSGILTGGPVGVLTKTGSGTLSLTGASTLGGITDIQAGTIAVGTGQSLGTGIVNLSGGKLLGTANLTMGSAVGDTLVFASPGATLAAAANTQFDYAGALVLNNTVEAVFGSPTDTGTVLLNLSGIGPGSNNTLRVAGGTLKAGNAQLGNLTGTVVSTTVDAGATLDFNGLDAGVVRLLGAGTVQMGSNAGATLSLQSGDFSGTLQGAGNVDKTTAGTLTLSGTNSYSGTTRVTAGTLLVDGDQSAATGAVTVASGAVLGGSGTLGGAVTVQNDGHLALGDTPRTLTMGALSLNPTSQFDFKFGQSGVAGSLLNDLVNVNGNLVLDGQLNVSVPAGGTFATGLYRVFNYTGSLTDHTLDIASAPVATSGLVIQTGTPGQINLVNATGITLQYWDPVPGVPGAQGGTGVWQGSTGNTHWSGNGVNDNAPFVAGAFALFTGTGGTVTVDSASHGPIAVQGMQFDADGYVLSGGTLQASTASTLIRVGAGGVGAGTTATVNAVLADDNVAGGTQLVKSDAGTLVLGGANTYRGGTRVSGGTLQVSADNNLGAPGGGLTLDGGTLQYGAGFASARAVVLGANGGGIDTRGASAALNGVVSGSGALTKTGAGTLTLTGANSYSGGTTVSAGTLQGNTTSLQGNIIDNANVAFDQVVNGSYAGTLTGTGSLTKLNAGTLTLTSTQSNYTGGTVVEGGTLQGNAGTLKGNIVTNANVTFDQATNGTYAGTLSGSGSLTKANAGTLTLTSTQSNYTGGTVVSGGTLLGSADTLKGDIANNANVTFDQAGTGHYDGAMSGSGTLTKTGGGVLTLTNNGNSYTGGTLIDAGEVLGSSDAFKGNIVNNASLVFDQPADSLYAGAIDGPGGLTKVGPGRVELTGISHYTGATSVNAGTLSVNGSIANSAVTVNNGGILGGTGTVGRTRVASGGVFAPGNSIGTITVNGPLMFASGSSYRVEIDPAGNADRINVVGASGVPGGEGGAAGTATLNGGTVDVRAGRGSYPPSTRYTILTAAGGVTGTFANATSDFAFLSPTLAYDPANVYLTLSRNDRSYGSIGVTPNQVATGNALQDATAGAQGGTLALLGAIDNLSIPQARGALDALSGELHASVQTALLEDSRFVREASLDRVRQAQGGATPVGMTFDGGGSTSASSSSSGSGSGSGTGTGNTTWARVFGADGHIDGGGNAARLKRDIAGFLVGADTRLDNGWRAGGLFGYSKSDMDVDGLNSTAKADNYHVGVYGGTQWDATSLRLGASYSWSKLATQRNVGFTGFGNSLKTDYDSSTTQVFGEVARRLDTGAVVLEPFAGLAYVNVDTKGFDENGGGGGAALHGSGGSIDALFSTLGLRASTPLSESTRLRGMLGWRHAFGDRTPTSTQALASGPAFSVSGVPLANDVAVLEAGIETQLQKNMTLGVSYAGQFGSGLTDYGIKVALGWKF